MEAYHVVVTHPQILESIGDSNSQYDVFGNFSRAISAGATPSPHLKAWPSEQEKLNSMLDVQYGAEPQLKVGENESARTLVAASTREGLRHVVGDGVDGFSDAEFTDSFYYTQFPNFHPWGGFNRITYRFRPNGDDPDTCIMETMFLAPCPKDGPRPAAAQIHWLGVDDDYTQAPELGMLARVFQQDTFNLPKVQIGLKAARQPYVQFANYNETKPRHFYHLYEQWLDLG